jgi:ribonuclease HI
MAGRVPTKVSIENGNIEIGDRITISAIPGVGMKANPLEASIGVALESFNENNESNLIKVFLDLKKEVNVSEIKNQLVNSTELNFINSLMSSISSRLNSTTNTLEETQTTIEFINSIRSKISNPSLAGLTIQPTIQDQQNLLKLNSFDGSSKTSKGVKGQQDLSKFGTKIISNSISVDAACSGNPGLMEYRGVHTVSREEIFRQGPHKDGTNNIGEFLALVHALAFLKKMQSNTPIYTDSRTAMAWVRNKKVKTTLNKTAKNANLFDMMDRAIKWLKSNTYTNKIIKWDTKNWGEIPADFGRK